MTSKPWILGLLVSLILSPMAGAAEWIGTWGAAPVTPGPALGPGAPPSTFVNQTVRQVVRISAGGDRIRLRLTNEYGTKPLTVGAARVLVLDASGAGDPQSGKPVLFGGKPSAVIPAGAPLLSDPIDLPVKALSSLAVNLYFPEDTNGCTCHPVGMQTAQISDAGDYTAKNFTAKATMFARAFLSGVEVESKLPAKAVVVLGDSISDGVGSTPDTNRRWPDLLAARLAARDSRRAWGLVNMGISGNRVLTDMAGDNALARLDRDVLSVPGVAYVIVFVGVNDLGFSLGKFEGPMAEMMKSFQPGTKVTADAMIAGYRQIIQRSHSRGVKVIGATIAPYGGAMYYASEGEAVRTAINQWIRTSGEFDAVFDFDAVFRDPAKPERMATALHSGDNLHGSDAGYEAVAKSIDLAVFK
jgi:lysophospholipase L1-like esterase